MTPEPSRSSSSSRLLPAILALCLAVETGVIVYLLNTRPPAPASIAPATASVGDANAASRIAALEAENARLKKTLATHAMPAARNPIDTKNIPGKITEALAGPAADPAQTKWQRLAALQRDAGFDARVFVTERPFDASSNTLSPAFVALFEITPGEQAALEKTIAEARGQVNDLTIKNAACQMLPDGSFEIKVAAFPEAGGAVYDQLYDQFRSTLGQDRYDAMLATSGRELDMGFSNFGAENRTLVISRDADTGSVSIKDTGEHEGMRRVSMTNVPDADIAREHLGHLSTLLPPGF